jgi:branched-chain amino acid transport system ATP-binding protein
MAQALLEVRNIETYYGPIMALRGISLEVHEGQIVTVLGANGAGKTTILKTISGIMEPSKGSISLEGTPIHRREPDWVARQGIAHVPEGREIFPFLTVRENLMMGAFTRHDRGNIASDLDAVFGYFPILRERADQSAAYLSGGQQQMLVIGRGLMARPKLMLLDEPSLGLSPLLVQEIFDIIRRLNRERKVTILLVEQNANMALQVAQHGYVLELGRIVMNDKSERLRQSSDVQEFFLGMKEDGVRGRRRWKRKKTWR